MKINCVENIKYLDYTDFIKFMEKYNKPLINYVILDVLDTCIYKIEQEYYCLKNRRQITTEMEFNIYKYNDLREEARPYMSTKEGIFNYNKLVNEKYFRQNIIIIL